MARVADNDPEQLRYDPNKGANVKGFASLPEFAKKYLVWGKGGRTWTRDEDAPNALQSWLQEYGLTGPVLGPGAWLGLVGTPDFAVKLTRRNTWGNAPWYVEAWRRGGFFYEPGEESTRWGGLLFAKAGVRREEPENPWIYTPLSAYRPRTVPPPDHAGAYESYLHMADFRDWKYSEWNIYLAFVQEVWSEVASCQAKNFTRSGAFECRHLLEQYIWLTQKANMYAKHAALNRGIRPVPLPPGREDEWM